jgi:hypothetical protein
VSKEPLVFDGTFVRTADGGLWGEYTPINPVQGDALEQTEAGVRRIVHSGTPADGLFDTHPLSWGAPAQDAFYAWCERATASGAELWIRTHARHVLCDATRCVTFAEWIAEKALPISILLEPESLFEGEMAADLEDHVERMFRLAGPAIAGVLVGGGAPGADIPVERLARAAAAASQRWGFSGELIAGIEHALVATEVFAATARTL